MDIATSENKPSKPVMFWVLGFINALLAIGIVGLGIMMFSGAEESQLHALSSGQRLVISTKSGEISGTMHNKDAGETAPPDATEEEAEFPAEPHEETPAAEEEASETEEETQEPVAESEEKKKITPDPGFDVGFDVGVPEGSVEGGESDTSSLVAEADEIVETLRVQPRTAASLTEPIDTLSEASEQGTIPKTGPEGTPRRYYARPFDVPVPEKPLISIIILDLGANKTLTEEVMTTLPAEISLAFTPYARDLKLQVENARNLGHEAWLIQPAQPEDFPASDPGPFSLLKDLKPAEQLQRLRQTMARAAGYVGLVLPINEIFSEQPSQLEPIVKELDARGLAIAAAQSPVNPGPADMLRSAKHGQIADFIVDETLNEADIKKQLKKLEEQATQAGRVLAVARPYPVTIRLLKEWNETLAGKNIALAPASALLELK